MPHNETDRAAHAAKPFGVLCQRNAASQFGAATRWLKSDATPDGLARFASMTDAQARADELNGRAVRNCSYVARAF
jgi:hypothetical protein